MSDKEYIKHLENTTRALMGYVMELHAWRNSLCDKKRYPNYETVKEGILFTFPMLQGFSQQGIFKKLGEKGDWKSIGHVVKCLTTCSECGESIHHSAQKCEKCGNTDVL